MPEFPWDSSELDFWCNQPEDDRIIRRPTLHPHTKEEAMRSVVGWLNQSTKSGVESGASRSLAASSACPTSTAFLAYAQFAAGATGMSCKV